MELNTDFLLGSELRSKLGSPVDLRGIPFVVEADGERIYVGAFQTLVSSIGFPGPGVMAEEIVDQGFAVYPPPNFRPLPPDGRQDARLVKVFTEAGKVAPQGGSPDLVVSIVDGFALKLMRRYVAGPPRPRRE